MKLKETLIVVVCILQMFNATYAQPKVGSKVTISGYVREAQSGESLPGVNIFVPELNAGTVTNTYGYYSMTVAKRDSMNIVFTYVGFLPVILRWSLSDNADQNIQLTAGMELKEVQVVSSRIEKISETPRMSTINVPISQIKNLPGLLGEKDVMKVLQLLPGVQKGSEGSSGIYVRGGGPDQNLIILDDAIVYNASHLFGFFSLFNGDALKSVELTKGGFPARYGGRLSSVIDMNMKEGNKQEWHGEGGIGLLSSRLTLEGPLVKNKSSILLSGRRTYIDALMRPFQKKTDIFGYYFYDLNAKVNYDFGKKDKLYLSGYFGNDNFYSKYKYDGYTDKYGINWGNKTGTLRWNHLFGNQLFANASVIYSKFKFGLYEDYTERSANKTYSAEYSTSIEDITFKYDVDYYPTTNHRVKGGLISIYHKFTPFAWVGSISEQSDSTIHDIRTTNGFENAIYAEDTWQPTQSLRFNLGVRYSLFLAKTKNYQQFEPRFSSSYTFANNWAMKASYAKTSQYLHLLSNTGISLPTDLWVPATDHIKPQKAEQYAVGLAHDVERLGITVSLEGYYKRMTNILGYKEGASFLDINQSESGSDFNWEKNVTSGKGKSYGAELLIQKSAGKFSGWIGYTLSWTKQQFDSLNFGKEFYPRYDRRHDLSIVGIYAINDHVTLSATWVYGTGNALTMAQSTYIAPNHEIKPASSYNALNGSTNETTVDNYGERNNFRMAPYHRLDVGIQFHKKTRFGERTWEFSAYNAYNRKNPYMYYTSQTDVGETKLKQMSLFPILPSITYSFKF